MRNRPVWWWIELVSVLCFGLVVYAKTPEIKGQVLDPTGGKIAGARVLLVNLLTLETKLVTTDQEGRFTFSDLSRVDYEVIAACRSFLTQTERVSFRSPDQIVVAGSEQPNSVTLKITLKVGHT